mmetsp:Transcript_53947/g.94607  ORF Transcript_53947/g.94607 Transcript_53947/m.94607 type:complete len:832 (+) Transcript_53947:1-2496(+)
MAQVNGCFKGLLLVLFVCASGAMANPSHLEMRQASSERLPLNGADQERIASAGRQLFVLALVGALSLAASLIGLQAFISTDFVKYGHPMENGPARGYGWSALLGMCIWIVAAPVSVAAVMKSALVTSKVPGPFLRVRGLAAAALFTFGLAAVLLSIFWLNAGEMLSCGYLWCYLAENSDVDPVGWFAWAGSQVFFSGLAMLVAGAALACKRGAAGRLAETDAERLRLRMKGAIRRFRLKRDFSVVVLLLGLPAMLVMTGLLPNTWERFSRAIAGGKVHSLKFFVAATGGIKADMQSEKPGAWLETLNWHLTDDVIVKFFPDTVLFYGFLEGIVAVCAIANRSRTARKILEQKLGTIAVGRLLLMVWFSLFLFLFIFYWAHDHHYHMDGKFDPYFLEKPARVSGVVAVMLMGLLLLPASKSSPVLAAAGISWESALWVHITIAVMFLLAAVLHVLLYFARFVQMGYPADILPFNARFWYPQNPVGGQTPSDNWTVPLMSTVFWPALVFFGIFPWLRRRNWELFRFSHNWFMVLVPAALWHATHSWYFVLPGVSLWMLDRVLRFLNATELVSIQELSPITVDCWTDERPGQPSRNVPEKITKVGFTWPGETRIHSPGMYLLVNFPEISLGEWHPFSISSSPLDGVTTMHIKNMGQGTFTGQLHKLASMAESPRDVVMNIQGPYGPHIDLHTVPRVLLVAGGIGVTPMINTLRCAVQRARAGDLGALKRIHFLWSARSADVFGILEEQLALASEQLPLEVKVSLYCSTKLDSSACSVGTIRQGMPNFSEVLAEEVALGGCLVRACGPPPMVNACAKASASFGSSVDFEPWSFVL